MKSDFLIAVVIYLVSLMQASEVAKIVSSIFAMIAFVMPMPASMAAKAEALFSDLDPAMIALKATHMKIIIALLSACVVFFATESVPLPAVALIIGLVQLFFGITPPAVRTRNRPDCMTS